MSRTFRIAVLTAALAAFALAAPARAQEADKPAEEAKPEIQKEVLATGEGELCGTGRAAVVHYVGTLTDGKQFDSSRDRKAPFAFVVGNGSVIEGWDETVSQMHVGDRWKVVIPWQKAYGAQGRPPVIPAKADLVFDIELLDVVEPKTEVVTAGEGKELKQDTRVEVRVKLQIVDGDLLKDSWKEGTTDQLMVGRPSGITGLDMVLSKMRVGDRCKARLDPALAFGAAGRPPRIPGNADLDIELEVVRVVEPIVEVLKEGDGPTPQKGQTVVVHYTGTLTDGTKFDSSRDRDEPFKFPLGLGRVIEGWEVVVSKMKVGERVRATIPWPMAYGDRAMPPKIPARADLVFDIELLAIE